MAKMLKNNKLYRVRNSSGEYTCKIGCASSGEYLLYSEDGEGFPVENINSEQMLELYLTGSLEIYNNFAFIDTTIEEIS